MGKSFVEPEERRQKNNEKIKSMGIVCLESLPLVESSREVTLKPQEVIIKRAISALLSALTAMDKMNGEDSRELYGKLVHQLNCEDSLYEVEKRVFEGTASDQDTINVVWEFECYWPLVWALGLTDEIDDATHIINVETATDMLFKSEGYDGFVAKTQLRDIEDILDKLDLYYRYHWATTENRINPQAEVAGLNDEIVMERRKALEWLISEEEDWEDISLDT